MINVLTGVAIVIAIAGDIYAARHPTFGIWWYGIWAVTCVVVSAIRAAQRNWGWALWLAVCAALINAWHWWDCRRKRRRKRAPRAYGAKSAALLAALVAKARAAAKPRTVLRPVPGGAR